VPVLRTLVYFGVLRGMERKAARAAAERWLERMSLSDRAKEPLKALSKGNQQKVQFITAILHSPRLAILDEPFSGLDPLNQDFFLGLIRDLRAEGMTVLFSAHQMQLVERLADRLLVMNRGAAVLEGTLGEIRRRWTTGSRILLRVQGDARTDFVVPGGGASARIAGPGEVELFVPEGESLAPILGAAAAALDVREIESHPVTLHDVYVATVGNGTQPAALDEVQP
jgi:ABC-2 type transport system ATP-binding protein